ncbi:mCG1049128 [Mus musculus]|jgi:hypothetical protein|nr:mCG1049128 [Mus musculus]
MTGSEGSQSTADNRAWWRTSVIAPLEGQRQNNCSKLEAGLSYLASPTPAKAILKEPVSKTKQQQNKISKL